MWKIYEGYRFNETTLLTKTVEVNSRLDELSFDNLPF